MREQGPQAPDLDGLRCLQGPICSDERCVEMNDESKRSTLCIVPCGKEKIWDREPGREPTPAHLVYIGSFASGARAYAEHFHPESWVVLSAMYGFLHPNDLVPGPYDVTLIDITLCPECRSGHMQPREEIPPASPRGRFCSNARSP